MEKTEQAKAGLQWTGYAHVGQVSNGKKAMWNHLLSGKAMMSDARRLVRPETAAQRSAGQMATDQYCQAARTDYDASS